MDDVAASHGCNKTLNNTDYQFFHTKSECKGGFVDGVQKHVSSLSKFEYENSLRVNSKNVTQNGMYKGLLPTLLDNGSKVINLDTQPVSPL